MKRILGCAVRVFSGVIIFGVIAVAGQDKKSNVEPQQQVTDEKEQSAKPGQVGVGGAKENGSNQISVTTPSHARDVVVRIEQQRSDQADNPSFAGWLRFLLGLLLPWPFLVLTIFLYLLLPTGAPSRIEALLKPFQSLKLFGQEFVLNSQSGRNAESAIDYYRKEVQTKLDRRVKQLKLRAIHEDLVKNHFAKLIPDFGSREIRTTVHIADSLFAETLYQLLDYYPPQLDSGRGRTFSTRFGIIGKAWRLSESQYAPFVPATEEALILEWGMTQEEATKAAGKDRQSFGCVILKDTTGKCIGTFYLDSPVKDAFGDEAKWITIKAGILEAARSTKLIAALELIYADQLKESPRVQIYSRAHMASH